MTPLAPIWKRLSKKLSYRVSQLEGEVDSLRLIKKRRRMPPERMGITKKVEIHTSERDPKTGEPIPITKDVYLTINNHEDGEPGEIFVRIGKEGDQDAIYSQFFTLMSISLQWGIPLSEFTDKFSYVSFGFPGITNDPEIPTCKSILDYIARRLKLNNEANERKSDAL